MAIVESNVELYTIHQGSGESLDEYNKVFKAQVDTIDAHGGNAGYHPTIYTAHKEATLWKKGMTREEYDALDGLLGFLVQRVVLFPRNPFLP